LPHTQSEEPEFACIGTRPTNLMRAALRRCGVITAKRLVACKDPSRLQTDALLHTNMLANGYSHWAVWDAKRQKILDPYYQRTRVFSYLAILRRNPAIKVF
jgi:hypothetical protein